MVNRKAYWMILVVPLLVLGCATAQPELPLEQKLAEQGYALGEEIDHIRDWNINGWSYVDDEHFVMYSGARDRYLITLKTHSLELRHATAIAFSTTASSVTDKDKVIIHGGPGNLRETIFIESLHKLRRIERPDEAT